MNDIPVKRPPLSAEEKREKLHETLREKGHYSRPTPSKFPAPSVDSHGSRNDAADRASIIAARDYKTQIGLRKAFGLFRDAKFAAPADQDTVARVVTQHYLAAYRGAALAKATPTLTREVLEQNNAFSDLEMTDDESDVGFSARKNSFKLEMTDDEDSSGSSTTPMHNRSLSSESSLEDDAAISDKTSAYERSLSPANSDPSDTSWSDDSGVSDIEDATSLRLGSPVSANSSERLDKARALLGADFDSPAPQQAGVAPAPAVKATSIAQAVRNKIAGEVFFSAGRLTRARQIMAANQVAVGSGKSVAALAKESEDSGKLIAKYEETNQLPKINPKKYTAVKFATTDSVRLQGMFVAAEGSQKNPSAKTPTLVMVMSNARLYQEEASMQMAERSAKLGFNVFLYNGRGVETGSAAPTATQDGITDCVAAIRKAADLGQGTLAVMGMSLGGALAAQALVQIQGEAAGAAITQRVKGVLLAHTFSSFPDTIAAWAPRFLRGVTRWVVAAVFRVLKLNPLDTAKAVGQLRGVGVVVATANEHAKAKSDRMVHHNSDLANRLGTHFFVKTFRPTRTDVQELPPSVDPNGNPIVDPNGNHLNGTILHKQLGAFLKDYAR